MSVKINEYVLRKVKNRGFVENYKKIVHEVKTRPTILKEHSFKIKEAIQSPGNDPTGLIFMDGFLYLADALIGKIFKIDTQKSEVVDEIKAPVKHPWGMCIGENSIWLTDDVNKIILNVSSTFDEVYRHFSYGQLKGKIDLDLHGLDYSRGSLWVSDFMGNRILRIDPSNGKINGEVPVCVPDLSGLLIDANFFWVASSMLSYIFKVDHKGKIHKIVRIMNGDYNHIHALTNINDRKIAFSSRNKLKIIIGAFI